MPRRRRRAIASVGLYVRWNLSIPADIAAQVETQFFDPITKKPRYGERNKLVTTLLREWVQRNGATNA